MKPLLGSVLATTCLLMLTGCFGGGVKRCDLRDGSGSEKCQEVEGANANAVYSSTCSAAGGTAEDGPCPDEGKLGACLQNDGADGRVLDWYYGPDETVEDVMARCDGEGQDFIAP
jgi:hypothetical protein